MHRKGDSKLYSVEGRRRANNDNTNNINHNEECLNKCIERKMPPSLCTNGFVCPLLRRRPNSVVRAGKRRAVEIFNLEKHRGEVNEHTRFAAAISAGHEDKNGEKRGDGRTRPPRPGAE